MKQMKKCGSDSSYISIDDTPKYAARNLAWGLYYNWRKNDLERVTYIDESRHFRELRALVRAIPCKTHQGVWMRFLHSSEVVDLLRTDGGFFDEMRKLITAVHYDAIMYMANNDKKPMTSLKKKVKTFIFHAKSK